MNVQIDTVLAVYDQEVSRLTKENVMLKAQLQQIEVDKEIDKEKAKEPEPLPIG